MKKTILSISMMMFMQFSFAQTPTSNTEQQSNPVINRLNNVVVENKPLKEENIKELNAALVENNYSEFFSKIATYTTKTSQDYIKYLNSKVSEHHIPVYWLMAEHYALMKNYPETHKWLYTAMIMTQQDAALCSDRTARFASQKLLRFFPSIMDAINVSPFEIDKAMQQTIFFIQNVKDRKPPNWVCFYGEEKLNYGANILINKSLWDFERRTVFKTFTEKYSK